MQSQTGEGGARQKSVGFCADLVRGRDLARLHLSWTLDIIPYLRRSTTGSIFNIGRAPYRVRTPCTGRGRVCSIILSLLFVFFLSIAKREI